MFVDGPQLDACLGERRHHLAQEWPQASHKISLGSWVGPDMTRTGLAPTGTHTS